MMLAEAGVLRAAPVTAIGWPCLRMAFVMLEAGLEASCL